MPDTETGHHRPFSMGETRRRLDVEGLIVTETTHTPDQRLGRHRHDLANILFVLDGAFTESIDGRTETCGRMSMFIRPAEAPHSNVYDSTGTRCLIIGIGPGWRGLGEPLSKILGRPSLNRNSAIAGLGLRLRREMMIADAASAISIQGVLLELMAEAMRGRKSSAGGKPPIWLRRVYDILNDSFSDSLDLGEIARHAGVHPVHLSRTFRHHYGCSVGEFVRRLRINFAEHKLTTSDMSLASIALEAGFSAQSHFSTVFRSLVGLTPAEYRAATRSNGPSRHSS